MVRDQLALWSPSGLGVVPELHVPSRAQCRAAAKGPWQEGTVLAVTAWGVVACSKASSCASALSPPFHNQFKSSSSLMSLSRSHTGVGGSWSREIIWVDQAGVDHGFPSRLASQLPHCELCFPLLQRSRIQHLERGWGGE